MTAEEAQARLERMVAASEDPALSDDEVTDLLAMCKLVDADGLAPDDEDWTPTYDLSRGAAEGWRWKAAKAASRFGFSTDNQRFDRDQVARACLEMARSYARKIACTVPMTGTLARSDD